MDNWRRKKSEIHNQDGTSMRSQNRNQSSGNWQPTVPAWEKKFCWEIGAVPWRKLLETKKIIHTYDNMLKWDDSAGEEAFHNAKSRYWAVLNGLQCDIPKPDPNAHIDDVDWDSKIDPELILDLDRDYVESEDSNKGERVLIFGDTFAKSQGFTDSGWGDADDFKRVSDSDLAKIREESFRVYADVAEGGNADVAERGSADVAPGAGLGGEWDVEDPWESKVQGKGDGWGKGWNCDSGWDKWENKVNKFGSNKEDYGYNGNYMSRYKTTRFHGDESEFGRNGNYNGNYNGGYNGNYRENSGRFMPKYKTTRFDSDDQVNNRNGRRRENFGHDEKPCRPINYRGSAKQGNHWGWEKSVK